MSDANDIRRELLEWAAQEMQRATAGLKASARHVEEVANRHVPVEEGDLKHSSRSTVDERELVAAVSYNTPYAARQHESTHLHHAPGKTAKWLENAMNSERDEIKRILADNLKVN